MSAGEFEGVKAYGALISEIKALPEARKPTPVDQNDPDDDRTDWDFSGSLRVVRQRLEVMFGPLHDSPFNRGFLKAMAWALTTEVNGFSVVPEHFGELSLVLESFGEVGDDGTDEPFKSRGLARLLPGRDLAVDMLREGQRLIASANASMVAAERGEGQQVNFARAYLQRIIDDPRLADGFAAVLSDVFGHSGVHEPERFAGLKLGDILDVEAR